MISFVYRIYKNKLRETEQGNSYQGLEGGNLGKLLINGYKRIFRRCLRSGDLIYSIEIIAKRVDFKYSQHKREMIIMWRDRG